MVQWRSGLEQRDRSDSGLADVWESELLIWTESRYRELYLDPPFPLAGPGYDRRRRARRVHPGGDPPERTHRAKPLY